MGTIYLKDLGKRLRETIKGERMEKPGNWKYTLALCGICVLALTVSVMTNEAISQEREALESGGGLQNQTEGSGGRILQDKAAVSEMDEMLRQTAALLNETENWGLGFGKEGERPSGNVSQSELSKYNAFYCAEGDEKKIYLTFDCGFENGNTEAILDALKKHNVTAAFFVVGHYLESAPELVKRMVEEGHIVANHTYHHPDMSKISDKDTFQKEMEAVSNLYKEIVGQEMPMYYRPPQGKYNLQNLQMAKDLGYSTFFWSLAYVDWNQDSQPSHEEAYKKLTTRVHPGAIVLLHNTSKTNGEIMDGILTKWEEMGYSFGSLADLTQKAAEAN